MAARVKVGTVLVPWNFRPEPIRITDSPVTDPVAEGYGPRCLEIRLKVTGEFSGSIGIKQTRAATGGARIQIL